MLPFKLSEKDKLLKIIKITGISKSDLARKLEVEYKTIYRWLDKGVVPHARQARDIDQLFKEYVDLREIVKELKKNIPDIFNSLKTNPVIKDKFLLEMTYN